MADKPTYEELEERVKRLEAALQKRSSRGNNFVQLDFQRFCEQSQDLIYYFAIASHEFLFLNSASATFFGYHCEDGIRLPAREVLRRIHRDDLPKVRAAQLRSLIPGCSAGVVEYRFLNSSNEWRWLHDKWVVLKGKAEKPVAIIGIARDETEHRAVREKLLQTESLCRAVFHALGIATVLADADMTMLYVNREFEKLTGYQRHELEGTKKWFDLIVGEDIKQLHEQNRLSTKADLLPRHTEFCILNKQGQIRHVLTTIDSVPGTEKRIVSGIDVTELRMTQRALAKAEERYRNLVDHVPQIVYEIDREGTFTYLNRAALALTGRTESDLARGIKLHEWLVPEDVERGMMDLNRVLNGERISAQQYRIRRKEGRAVPVLSHAAPIVREDHVVGLWGFYIEIGGRKNGKNILVRPRRMPAP